MRNFVKLFDELDNTTSQNAKIEALISYFKNEDIDDKDKMWTVALFSHHRPPRAINSSKIREWSAELANLPLWLFEETYHIVGDLAETIALVCPPMNQEYKFTLNQRLCQLKELKKIEDAEIQKSTLINYWMEMNRSERFLFNKLLTGGFRVGISQKIITKALAKAISQSENEIAQRLMGDWSPDNISWKSLFLSSNTEGNLSKPYPFYLAYSLDKTLDDLGSCADWVAEFKWDGIRGQIIIRNKQVFVWSRGEELITDKFPEFLLLKDYPVDIVLDGEIIVMNDNLIGNFNQLQTRIGRKNLSKKILQEVPAAIILYDILEYEGKDIRSLSYDERRIKLEEVHESLKGTGIIKLSKSYTFDNWDEYSKLRSKANEHNAEGLMLKKKQSTYQVGRKKGDWYKWKIDPYTVDAVMIYAQRGHGRRANLYTDFTFAIYDGDKLVPFTKAYSGLKDQEFKEVTEWVKNNTIERFGPVCSVRAELVFEIAFEGIALSKRHKSGIALRFPRIKTWRKDKPVSEIDKLEDLKSILTGGHP